MQTPKSGPSPTRFPVFCPRPRQSVPPPDSTRLTSLFFRLIISTKPETYATDHMESKMHTTPHHDIV